MPGTTLEDYDLIGLGTNLALGFNAVLGRSRGQPRFKDHHFIIGI